MLPETWWATWAMRSLPLIWMVCPALSTATRCGWNCAGSRFTANAWRSLSLRFANRRFCPVVLARYSAFFQTHTAQKRSFFPYVKREFDENLHFFQKKIIFWCKVASFCLLYVWMLQSKGPFMAVQKAHCRIGKPNFPTLSVRALPKKLGHTFLRLTKHN